MDLLTVDETAQMLKVNSITVRRFIASGRLPAVRVGRRVRVRREEIEALLVPVALNEPPLLDSSKPYTFVPAPPEEVTRRKALFDVIVARRKHRHIAPFTSVDLIRMAREEAANR